MYVSVCLDVEDLVHPDADDAELDVAKLLAGDGVVATMSIVGEKVRLWERRGRTDVIAAIGAHDVGLHSDHHSMHPVIAEYLADKGWADGVAEAVRQESPGMRDIAHIFGRPPICWATPGTSWGPQIPAATRQLGIPSNIYSYPGRGGTGACWFAGQLCYAEDVYLSSGCEDVFCDDLAFEAALPKFLQSVTEAKQRGAVCVSLFGGHPNRFRYTVHWDALNFVRGEQTDPAHYRFAPRRDDEVYRTGLRNLRRMIAAVRDLPGVEILSLRTLNEHWEAENAPLTTSKLLWLARDIVESGVFRTTEPLASPAQMLDALGRAVLSAAETGHLPRVIPLRPVLGPVEPPSALEQLVSAPAERGLVAFYDLLRHVDATAHLPMSVTMSDVAIGPGPLLRTAAAAVLHLDSGHDLDRIVLTPGAEEPDVATTLSDRVYQQMPNWPPHPLGLRLDRIALHSRLQTWSQKPAVLRH